MEEAITGLIITGTLQEHLGSKSVLIAGMISMAGAVITAVLVQGRYMLLAAELIEVTPW
jgi:MFS-type transporter involved in bile tolerance (Atg22 family)